MFLSPNASTKAKQRLLVNGFVSQHDLLCCCNRPAFHCFNILAEQLSKELSPKEKQQIISCLGTTEDTTAGTTEDHGIDDLEKLFAEGTTEDADG